MINFGGRPNSPTRLAQAFVQALALLLGSAVMAGCAQLGELDARLQGLADDEGKPAESTPAEQSAVAPPADRRSLDAILDDLQRGGFARGRRDLARYLERHPDDMVARAVMRQLTADPEAVLGRQSHEYVVRPGDSYSALAARHLGDAGLFLILARYNDSANPSDLRIGETLRLPGQPRSSDAGSTASAEEGQPARRQLDRAPIPSQKTAAALALPDAPLPSFQPTVTEKGGAVTEASSSAPTDAERLQREAMALLADDRPEAALKRFEAALAEQAGIEPAASRVPALRERLVDEYHQRAILRYRNQDLGEAIALWDRVLAIDPTFEPARTYRARARELQRRVDQL
ncbi:LysM domain-containing protein [Guyparkeria halophila]|uniref:LysM domain-containing protein n=1 Tax=Guyparkeria halophila TaxID=47960 RepID=A0ABZ0YW47_9GAMM|nr:LysM domain-containing protein [Guyparkeria halophila]WQH16408.1 LysM domain-containing protein [Guyparkeria halophila]